MILLTEVAKMNFCFIVLFFQYSSATKSQQETMTNLKFTDSLHFLVPSALYALSNTLAFISLNYINPGLFHVFGNLRLLTAGILYKVFMNRKQTDIQWCALFLIMFGAMLASPVDMSEFKDSNTIIGIMITILMCSASTCSSVYTEKIFKASGDLSIFYKNIVLYLYGILVNMAFLLYNEPTLLSSGGFLTGWNFYTYLALLSQSAMGITLSFIFQYLDSIVYTIALTVSMFMTSILSSMFFEFEITLSFLCSVGVVSISVYLYYRQKAIEMYQIDEKKLEF